MSLLCYLPSYQHAQMSIRQHSDKPGFNIVLICVGCLITTANIWFTHNLQCLMQILIAMEKTHDLSAHISSNAISLHLLLYRSGFKAQNSTVFFSIFVRGHQIIIRLTEQFSWKKSSHFTLLPSNDAHENYEYISVEEYMMMTQL